MLEQLFRPYAESGLIATAEALFPENAYGAPDYKTTDLVHRMLEYWKLLPSPQRRLLVFLFALVELLPPILLIGTVTKAAGRIGCRRCSKVD